MGGEGHSAQADEFEGIKVKVKAYCQKIPAMTWLSNEAIDAVQCTTESIQSLVKKLNFPADYDVSQFLPEILQERDDLKALLASIVIRLPRKKSNPLPLAE